MTKVLNFRCVAFLEQLLSPISGAVVDDDNLEIIVGLGKGTLDGGWQQVLPIIRGDDNTHKRWRRYYIYLLLYLANSSSCRYIAVCSIIALSRLLCFHFDYR